MLLHITVRIPALPADTGPPAGATRDVFSAEELARLRGFPEITRAELVRYFTLTSPDEAFLRCVGITTVTSTTARSPAPCGACQVTAS